MISFWKQNRNLSKQPNSNIEHDQTFIYVTILHLTISCELLSIHNANEYKQQALSCSEYVPRCLKGKRGAAHVADRRVGGAWVWVKGRGTAVFVWRKRVHRRPIACGLSLWQKKKKNMAEFQHEEKDLLWSPRHGAFVFWKLKTQSELFLSPCMV